MKKIDLNNEVFDLMEINEVEVLFTPMRINRTIIPPTLFAYDIRGNDNGTNDFATIEQIVRVNHTGTIISKEDLLMGAEYIDIDDYGFMGESTLSQYLNGEMEIETIISPIDHQTYRLFHICIGNERICVAEEKLEKHIKECIDNKVYDMIVGIDDRYAYYVPQDIADTENEEEIVESVVDAMDI